MTTGKQILELLLQRYPDPRLALHFSNPLELLVATILSAQCLDSRVNQVTRSLFMKYQTPQDYAMADLETFQQEIRSTGFYKNKAKMIIQCCQQLVEKFSGQVPDDVEALTRLPGVGRKTAQMVLGNAFGKQAIAVDTHVLRVSNRLGLSQAKNPDKVEKALMQQVPEGQWTAFTNAMILHGREICTASKPRCSECILHAQCAWPQKTGGPDP